jgi:hypothetical protein
MIVKSIGSGGITCSVGGGTKVSSRKSSSSRNTLINAGGSGVTSMIGGSPPLINVMF